MKLVCLLLICLLFSCGKDPALLGGAPRVLEKGEPLQKVVPEGFPKLKIKSINEFKIQLKDFALENGRAIDPDYSYFRSKVLRSIYKQLESGDRSDLNETDEPIVVLNKWDYGSFFVEQTDGTITLKLSFNKGENFKDVSMSIYSFDQISSALHKISKVVLDDLSGGVDVQQTVDRQVLLRAISHQHQFLLKIDDYKVLQTNGSYLSYQTFLKNRKKKIAKVIISTNEKQQEYFVPPGKSLRDVIALPNLPVSIEPVGDWKRKEWSQTNQGKWFYLGDYNSHTKVVAGETYVVAYAKWWQLFNAANRVAEKSLNISYENPLSDIGPGTVLTFSMQGRRPIPKYEDVEQVVEYGIKKKGHIYWGNWCTIMTREYVGVEAEEIIFSPKLIHLPVSLKIGEKLYRVDEMLTGGKELMLLKDGRQIKFKVFLSGQLIPKLQTIRIKMNQIESNPVGTIGFIGMGTCLDKENYVFRSPLPQTEQHHVPMPLFDTYIVDLRIERQTSI